MLLKSSHLKSLSEYASKNDQMIMNAQQEQPEHGVPAFIPGHRQLSEWMAVREGKATESDDPASSMANGVSYCLILISIESRWILTIYILDYYLWQEKGLM